MKLYMYPFRGHDFMELAKAWNIYVGHEFWLRGVEGYHEMLSDADVISIYLQEVLSKSDGVNSSRVMKKHARDIRVFTKALSAGMTYDAPLWYGMSKIEDDRTLILYAIQLMGNMWN